MTTKLFSATIAGLDAIGDGDGEQSRQHFVQGFLEQVEGIDFDHKVRVGIRDNRYDAMVPQVVSAIRLKGRVHATEARLLRAHTSRKIKFTVPGLMTIADILGKALQYVVKNRLLPCTNCGLAPMDREMAVKQLHALAQGVTLARKRYGGHAVAG